MKNYVIRIEKRERSTIVIPKNAIENERFVRERERRENG